MTKASQIVSELDRLYRASVDRLQAALNTYLTDGTPPSPQSRLDGSFAYPVIRLRYAATSDRPAPPRSFGRLVSPGDYTISVTKPALFADFLTEQLTLLIEDYVVEVEAVLVAALLVRMPSKPAWLLCFGSGNVFERPRRPG